MKRYTLAILAAMASGMAGVAILKAADGAVSPVPNLQVFNNAAGQSGTFNARGILDPANPFFEDLGSNGRMCVTCHPPESGWTLTPAGVQQRFAQSDGLEPLFRTNDGSNCGAADVSTLEAREAAYSMLLNRALIRVSIDVPTNAEFVIESADDPYNCQGASLTSPSLFRRPLPATNLRFLSAVMWDGRESPAGRSISDSLMSQARDATLGHAQASLTPTDAELRAIVDFETQLYTAQTWDKGAGNLGTQGATGGPQPLSRQPFFIGMNDPLGQNPTGAAFSPVVFTIFSPWASLASTDVSPRTRARAAIARGQAIFNTKIITIAGVGGLNDELGLSSIRGTCTTCHDTPDVGNHSVKAPLNLGLTDAERRTPDMPLYTLRNLATGQSIQTTDPGRAMITGKWKDIGRFKGPVLRGLSARAPYFHNGFAATLADLVDFYDTRFNIGFTEAEKQDLLAFLAAL
jgi:hypothetical protein